jgi:hypothetical protein
VKPPGRTAPFILRPGGFMSGVTKVW